jgi:hypothetical protein
VASGAQIYTSSDSGLHWTGQESARNWSAVASSSDGSKLAAVDSFGQIHTGVGSPATPILTGGSGSSVDLVYAGNGQFVVVGQQGSVSLSY